MADQDKFQEDGNVDDSKLKLPDVKFEHVEAKSSEEEEEVVFKTRARLLRFDVSVHTGEKEWKQRGTGVVKILRHKEANKCRLLMRQDKTLKICANHIIAPEIELGEHASTDKAWLFNAEDFADEELKHETFCIMFRNAETAKEFKANHDKARAINSGSSGAGAGDGAAAAAAPAAAAPAEASKAEEEEEEAPVPFYNAVEQIYGAASKDAQTARYTAFSDKFTEKFGSKPDFFVRAPGRVNLIGEHIDYHGYNVMPMALSNDIVIAVGVIDGEDTVTVANFQDKYPAGVISADPTADLDMEEGAPSWYHYVQCGYKAAFHARGGDDTSHVGMQIMVTGNVPAGAGLSSSSALVVASTLATAVANRIPLSKVQVAKAAIFSERFVGTMSGGMDQTISCLAEAGKASEIQFNPLKASPVSLPEGVVFVVGHSLINAPKAIKPWEGYNARVTEGKLGAKLLAKNAGVADWRGVQTVLGLQQALGLSKPAELLDLIAEHVPEASFDKAALAAAFGTEDLGGLFEGDPKHAGAVQVLEHVESFELFKRLRHVASEAGRVDSFVEMCSGEGAADTAALGALLSASHTSCDADYACSHAQLNELVATAVEAGALGARLTGAGWGGCMVAMVAEGDLEGFLTTLKEKFYAGKLADGADVNAKLFATAPGNGIAVLMLA